MFYLFVKTYENRNWFFFIYLFIHTHTHIIYIYYIYISLIFLNINFAVLRFFFFSEVRNILSSIGVRRLLWSSMVISYSLPQLYSPIETRRNFSIIVRITINHVIGIFCKIAAPIPDPFIFEKRKTENPPNISTELICLPTLQRCNAVIYRVSACVYVYIQ